MIFDPSQHAPGDIYKLMTGLIVPRPIAFVSSLSPDGVRNLAPFSVCFSPMIRGADGSRKDTLINIEATGEFVVSVVSEEFARQMNVCSAEYPPSVDEFVESGLTPVPSDLVRPPRVGEALAAMECRLVQIVHVSPKPLGGSLVLGEVLRFHVADAIAHEYRIDPAQLHAIGRMGGPTYARTTDRFDLPRPVMVRR
jgi:flavin reductase (DIM6/NTAB) family NADH-FMN oxidoreductase RutF